MLQPGETLQSPDLTLTLQWLSCALYILQQDWQVPTYLSCFSLNILPPSHLQPNQIRAMSKQHTSYVPDTLLILTH